MIKNNFHWKNKLFNKKMHNFMHTKLKFYLLLKFFYNLVVECLSKFNDYRFVQIPKHQNEYIIKLNIVNIIKCR